MSRIALILLLGLTVSAQTRSLFTRRGGEPGERFGHALAIIEDVNGDRRRDVLVGAPGFSGDRGRARILSGADGSVLWTFVGESGQDGCGAAVADVGDLDGDGWSDFAIGYPGRSRGRLEACGAVEIHSGRWLAERITRNRREGQQHLAIAWGRVPGEGLGQVICPAGDLDADGVLDIAIGAPLAAVEGRPEVGRVRVHSGEALLALHRNETPTRPEILLEVTGSRAHARLGRGLAGGADFNGDGYDDLAIGAPGASNGGIEAGNLRVWSGEAATANAEGKIARSPTWLLVRDGATAEARLGASVAFVRSVDGDAWPELLVGAPARSDAFGERGQVLLLAGAGPAGNADETGRVLWSRAGGRGESFGERVGVAGDVNGDGLEDLVVSAPRTRTRSGARAGRVRLYSGAWLLRDAPDPSAPEAGLLASWDGARAGAGLGAALAMGDLDDDRLSDLVLGAPHPETGFTGEARAFGAWRRPGGFSRGGFAAGERGLFGQPDPQAPRSVTGAPAGSRSRGGGGGVDALSVDLGRLEGLRLRFAPFRNSRGATANLALVGHDAAGVERRLATILLHQVGPGRTRIVSDWSPLGPASLHTHIRGGSEVRRVTSKTSRHEVLIETPRVLDRFPRLEIDLRPQGLGFSLSLDETAWFLIAEQPVHEGRHLEVVVSDPRVVSEGLSGLRILSDGLRVPAIAELAPRVDEHHVLVSRQLVARSDLRELKIEELMTEAATLRIERDGRPRLGFEMSGSLKRQEARLLVAPQVAGTSATGGLALHGDAASRTLRITFPVDGAPEGESSVRVTQAGDPVLEGALAPAATIEIAEGLDARGRFDLEIVLVGDREWHVIPKARRLVHVSGLGSGWSDRIVVQCPGPSPTAGRHGDLVLRGHEVEDLRLVRIRSRSLPLARFVRRHGPVVTGRHRALFAADDGVTGEELWVTDGTSPGTRCLADLAPGPASSAPRALCWDGERWWFTARDPEAGREIWISDGSPSGTRRVRDILPGPAGSEPRDLTPLGDGRMVFTARGPEAGREPWITDGTAAGTRLLCDVRPGAAGSDPIFLGLSGSPGGMVLHFAADDGRHGHEPWISELSAPGARLLCDLRPGPDGSSPRGGSIARGAAGGDTLFFTADDGVHGRELWRHDGAAARPHLVIDARPGPVGSDPGPLQWIAPEGGVPVALLSLDDGVHGREPWRTDGTPVGTHLVHDVVTGAAGSDPRFVSGPALRPVAVFVARSAGDHVGLWASDGSVTGTKRHLSSRADERTLPHGLTAGRELWLTSPDGRGSATLRLIDLSREEARGSHWTAHAVREGAPYLVGGRLLVAEHRGKGRCDLVAHEASGTVMDGPSPPGATATHPRLAVERTSDGGRRVTLLGLLPGETLSHWELREEGEGSAGFELPGGAPSLRLPPALDRGVVLHLRAFIATEAGMITTPRLRLDG